MKTGPDISTIYRIARYYYADGLSQEEIATKEGFSRSQISRLLEKAKSMGMVRITLVPPESQQSEELSEILAEMMGLKSVLVVPIAKTANRDEIVRAIATRAADFLSELLPSFNVVGIGWGKTVYETSMLLSRHKGQSDYDRQSGYNRQGNHDGQSNHIGQSKHLFFVPLIGLSGDTNPNLQINTIIDRFSSTFQSKGLFINLSSVREKGRALSNIEEHRIRALQEYWKQVEVAVVGLGTPPTFSINILDELPEKYKEELKKSSSCADILAQFFDEKGTIFHSEHEYDLVAYDIRDLSNLQRSICLAGGELKVPGIIAAAQARFISDFVTDEQTALAILKLLREEKT
ncbi:MAG: Deoxyribonucleoside regulator [Spirochaetes bacterium ADurb.Bin110]|nr:MAG: Deoxyribonucleoside regulator [Spirochaetes bacterium ADurb.Bin110]